ncbi:unnamed protein product [Discosporangium mesarthrocarpum]
MPAENSEHDDSLAQGRDSSRAFSVAGGDVAVSGIPDWETSIEKYIWFYKGQGIDVENVKFGDGLQKGVYYPFPNQILSGIYLWCFRHNISRRALSDLLAMMRFREPIMGGGFEVDGRPESADHFLSAQREYMPLLRVDRRRVTSEKGRKTSACHFPLNLVLDSVMRSPLTMRELDSPGGHTITNQDARDNRIPYEHVLVVPTKREDKVRGSQSNEEVQKRFSLHGIK